MNACKDLVDRKSSELRNMAALVAEKEELVESLKMEVDSLETINQECKEECAKQKQSYQNERSSMVRKLTMMKKKRKILKLECADLLEKLQSQNEKQHENMEMLQKMKERCQIKRQTLFHGNDLDKLIEENQEPIKQVEKTLQENNVLKNAMQEKEEPKKMQGRATELLAKENEMPRWRDAFYEESMKVTEMKQKLEQSDNYKARDLMSVKARFDKSLARLAKADERDILVEEENLRLSRSYNMLMRELKAARVELNVLKVRYGNAEEACKEHEDKIKHDKEMKQQSKDF
eukprot:gene6351-7077_t